MNWDELKRLRDQQRGMAALDFGTPNEPSNGGFFGDLAHDTGEVVGGVSSFFGNLVKGFVDPIVKATGTVVNTLTAPERYKQEVEKFKRGEITQEELDKRKASIYSDNLEKKVVTKNGKTTVEQKDIGDFTKGFFATGADLGTTYAPLAKGASVAFKSGQKLKDVAVPLLKEGTAYGTAQTGADILNDRDVNLLQNYTLGIGGSYAGYGIAKGADKALAAGKKVVSDTMENNPGVLGFDDQYKQLAEKYDNTADPLAKKQISQAMADNRVARGATLKTLKEGGYIQLPGGGALDDAAQGADLARRQLAGEDISSVNHALDPDEQIAQEVASQYSSPEQYLNDRAKQALQAEKGMGPVLVPSREGEGSIRASQHSPWYSNLYSETGRQPSQTAVRAELEKGLTGGGDRGGLVYPGEDRVYDILKEREAGLQRAMEQGPPSDLYPQWADTIGVPAGRQSAARTPVASEPSVAPIEPQKPSERAIRGQAASETNPAIDFVDTSALPSGAPKPGVQQKLPENPTPYAGMEQNLNTLALPQGEIRAPSPKAAKSQFKKDKQAVDFLNKQRPGSKPIELPSSTEDFRDIATRETPGGKVKPLATNNAHITTDDVAAIRAIADDGTGDAFTMTRTPEMNLEEATARRGGVQSKEFRTLDKFNTSIREHTAEFTRDLQSKRDILEGIVKNYGINGPKAQDMRPYLEAGEKDSARLLQEYADKHGAQAAEGLRRLRVWWRATAKQTREETNAVIEKYAGKDRIMGDLGETYVPRVYKQGMKGLKDTVLDVAHAGLDRIGGKNGMFNLENGTDYLSKENESFGGVLRNTEGIPLNSELSKPNTTYLSAAQKRTAKAPIGELQDPITSMLRYFESTGRAKYYTEDIARGRTLQKAIEYVNNETGNLRQMYKSFDDQINSIAGKTSRIDRPFVDSKGGAQFVNAASKIQSRIARSTILGSASSAFAQTGQLPLVAAENGVKNFTGGMQDMLRMIRSDKADPLEQSALMTSRYPKNENLFAVKKSTRAAQKGSNAVAKPFRIIEKASSELAWRSSYRKALEDGMTGKQAIQEADRITARIIGERSPGARAALYESKALGPATSYTLEVNQLYQVAKQYFKRDPKRAAKLVGAIWLYNQGYQAVTGNKLNADPISAVADATGDLTTSVDENGNEIGFGERLVRAGGRLVGEAIDATPLGGPVVGQLYPEQGFRVPFGGGDRVLSRADIFGGTNIGRYGGGTPIASGLSNPLLLLGVPGMAQLQRSVEGSNAYNQGASMTPAGNTRFDIQQDPENYWRSLLFGMYNTKEGQAYLASQNANLAGR